MTTVASEQQLLIPQPSVDNSNIKARPYTPRSCGSIDIRRLLPPLLTGFFVYYGIFIIIPLSEFINSSQLFRNIFTILMIILIVITYFSYIKCAYSYPGHVPNEWLLWDGTHTTRPKYPIYCENINRPFAGISELRLYCSKCKLYRPPRTAHCSKCNICVTRMDHHCNYMHNCIGINNHRYFMQYLFYLSIILIIFLYFFQKTMDNIYNSSDLYGNIYLYYFGIVLNIIGYPILLFCVITLQGNIRSLMYNTNFLQLKYQLHDTGSYSYYADSDCINYDTKSKLKNIESVFGENKLKWFLPFDLNKNDIQKTMIEYGYHGSWELLPYNLCNAKHKQIIYQINTTNNNTSKEQV